MSGYSPAAAHALANMMRNPSQAPWPVQQRYEQFVADGRRMIPDRIGALIGAGCPVLKLANVAAAIISDLRWGANQRGRSIDDGVWFYGAAAIVDELAGASAEASIHAYSALKESRPYMLALIALEVQSTKGIKAD